MQTADGFDSWCIAEFMGHTRVAGRVTEEEHFGAKLGRIDVPRPDGSFTTVYFGAGSIFRLTPCTEEIARAVAARSQPEPVHAYELPKPEARPVRSPSYLDGDRDEDEDDGF